MEDLEALIGLNMIPTLKPLYFKKLLDYFQKPSYIFKASVNELGNLLDEETAKKIVSFKEEEIKKEIDLIKKYKLKIITLKDKDYPLNLKSISDPPVVLYVKGKLQQKDILSIAIVGSRQASFYGLECSYRFAYSLAELGITVVSGMAKGIDTQAHRGALKAKGRTIAVMGSGFSFIYPKENIALVDEIASCGAVLTEFPCNTEPFAFNFPRRNRIISGLALGVLVVEAGKKSGALITANFALEENREVFCIPGRFDSPNSLGTHQLIKEGAKLVCGIEDILEELNIDSFKKYES